MTWVISEFTAPVDHLPVLNTGKAGRAVPLKWHLADTSGNSVTTLTTAEITVKQLNCETSEVSDPLEQTLTVGGGLKDLGNGDYQLNWKTNAAWAGSCKVMTLDLGGGVTQQANFKFTK